MGTRHLIAIFSDSEYKLAQYGQWDGYPSGQGIDILNFLSDPVNRILLRDNLNRLYEASQDEIVNLWKEFGIDIVKSDGMVPIDAGEAFSTKYPTLSRNCGADVLGIITAAEGDTKIPTRKTLGFAGDSLFCEWAYVIDFDKGVFEVYKGFNEVPTPADSRFPSGADWLEKTDKYEPVVLEKSYPLDALPDQTTFYADLGVEQEVA